MSSAEQTIKAAQSILGEDLELDRLDQIFDLQRLIGPVIAYKVLLNIVINSVDPKEQRLAASQLLSSADEDPERIAERLRASEFRDLSLEDLENIVQSGVTDPEKAADKIKEIREGERVA